MTILLGLGGLIILLDQFSKFLVLKYLPLHSRMEIFPGVFDLVHVRNTGGAFSLFAGGHSPWRTGLFVGLTTVVLVIILFAYRKLGPEDRWSRIAYTCIVSGALGNLVDRLRFGEVVDFLDFYVGSYHWPAFNVADSAITVGAILLGVSLFRNK